jgi:hypothetical protein
MTELSVQHEPFRIDIEQIADSGQEKNPSPQMQQDTSESLTARLLCRISITYAPRGSEDHCWHEVVVLLSGKKMH